MPPLSNIAAFLFGGNVTTDPALNLILLRADVESLREDMDALIAQTSALAETMVKAIEKLRDLHLRDQVVGEWAHIGDLLTENAVEAVKDMQHEMSLLLERKEVKEAEQHQSIAL